MSFISRSGYLYLEFGGARVQNSRFVMEQHLDRKLGSKEIVHHKDGNTLNDSIENLEIVTPQEHVKLSSFTHNTPHSEESIERMRQSHIGNKGALGHKLSEETKRQIGEKTSQTMKAYWERKKGGG